MKVQDAPPAGWYPDPAGYSRLRWWEGTDWSDRYRAPPTPGVVEIRAAYDAQYAADHADPDDPHNRTQSYAQPVYGTRQDTDAIVQQVRMAAREEAERAATLFGQQARSATRNIVPLITQYTSKFVRWVRILSTIAMILVIAWIAFQVFAQVSLFEWIGDRIDNLTDNTGTILRSP
jgi:hypothetical protein